MRRNRETVSYVVLTCNLFELHIKPNIVEVREYFMLLYSHGFLKMFEDVIFLRNIICIFLLIKCFF